MDLEIELGECYSGFYGYARNYYIISFSTELSNNYIGANLKNTKNWYRNGCFNKRLLSNFKLATSFEKRLWMICDSADPSYMAYVNYLSFDEESNELNRLVLELVSTGDESNLLMASEIHKKLINK